MHVEISNVVQAKFENVAGIYGDYLGWPRLFPTISAVRLIDDHGAVKTLEIQHSEGIVINTLEVRPVSATCQEIHLAEWKRRYDATFVNRFEALATEPGASSFSIIGDIRLKGWRVVAAPLARPYARRLMWHLQLAPVKAAAERSRRLGG